MLKRLTKRYDYLCKAKFDEAREVEEDLTRIKNEHYADITVPNSFYCTFMEGVG